MAIDDLLSESLMEKIYTAITGGIGSGKSSVAEIIRAMGFPVFSCDKINRELMEERSYIEAIKHMFPDVVQSGKIIKEKLAKLIFDDKKSLEKLNAFSHPLIMQTLQKQMKKEDSKLVFAEVPLLFESNSLNCFDRAIVVIRSKEARIRAVMERDKTDRDSVLSRIKNQYDYEGFFSSQYQGEKKILLLKNDGNFSILEKQIQNIIKILSASFRETIFVEQKK